MEYRNLSDLSKLENNPRKITDKDFAKLVKSIKDNWVWEGRPLLLSDRTGELVVIWWNQRYEACKKLGIEKVPTFLFTISDLEEIVKKHLEEYGEIITIEEAESEIVVRDNVSNGEWDIGILNDKYSKEKLVDWGVDISFYDELEEENWSDDTYTKKIEAPIYEPTWEKPAIKDLMNRDKTMELIIKIQKSSLSEVEKEFLINAAYRHTVFEYGKIAEFYAHQSKEMQEFMEESALVIIDFDKAIEWWYVELSDNLKKLYASEYTEE